jgi:hypothetical protein
MLGFDALGRLALGQISSNPVATVSIEKGDLTLTGGVISITLLPFVSTDGASGERKKGRRYGFEPVKKTWERPLPETKPKVWTPPRPVELPPRQQRPAPELVDKSLVPSELLAIQQQMFDAEDISALNRYLDGLEQDEQDAADIAELLELLD